MTITLPPALVQRVVAVHGARGAAWLRALPRHVELLRQEWNLGAIGEPFAGARPAFVTPVRTAQGSEFVLKIVPSAEWAAREAAALAHWAGRGAVVLEQSRPEHGALLMERAIPGDPLSTLCSTDDRAATAAAAAVIAELRTADRAPDPRLPDLATWIDALQPSVRGGSARTLTRASNRASAVARELLDGGGRTMLHGDLQHSNVLRAWRAPWLAVDPKGVVGPADAEAAALLRNPRAFVLSHPAPLSLLSDRVDTLAERLGDDPGRVVLWGYVLAVLAAAWADEDREGDAEVRRWLACADLLWRLARMRHAA